MLDKKSIDPNVAGELCMLIQWLESMSKGTGGVILGIDAKALGCVARKMRAMYEALDALVADAEEVARTSYTDPKTNQFEANWKDQDPDGYEIWSTGKKVLGLCLEHSSKEPPGD